MFRSRGILRLPESYHVFSRVNIPVITVSTRFANKNPFIWLVFRLASADAGGGGG